MRHADTRIIASSTGGIRRGVTGALVAGLGVFAALSAGPAAGAAAPSDAATSPTTQQALCLDNNTPVNVAQGMVLCGGYKLREGRDTAVVAPTCAGKPATIVGTPLNDVIDGTPGDDVIVALAGRDYVSGRGGNDVICGGPGSDTLHGNDGNDRLYGQLGADVLVGQRGRDLLSGGDGPDILNAVAADNGLPDSLFGGAGVDALVADDGVANDSLFGGPAADNCSFDLGEPAIAC